MECIKNLIQAGKTKEAIRLFKNSNISPEKKKTLSLIESDLEDSIMSLCSIIAVRQKKIDVTKK